MEKKEVEQLLNDIQYKYRLAVGGDHVDDSKLYKVCQIALAVATDSASVPEREFADSLTDLLLQNGVDLDSGWMNDDDYDEIFGNDEKAGKEYLEMFINPRDMFLDGKIRPDIVFRKGKGNCIIFEIDSFQYHSNQTQLTADKVRERKIQSLGHPVYRFSAKECLDGKSWTSAIEAYEILKKNKFI